VQITYVKATFYLRMCFSATIKSVSVQTQLHSIYYIEPHVSAYLRPSSGSQLVSKTYQGRYIRYVSLL
jgi:hypothetical protein